MERLRKPVGVFDSGVGGVSVLAEALKTLPHEDYVYFGDTLHIPYGDKEPEEVVALTFQAAAKLMNAGCKAIVLACNTATSVAAGRLRAELELPIIGIEPALKPANQLEGEGDILVMATRMTLSQPKFQMLMAEYGRNAVPVPCPGLMECVEEGELSGSRVAERLSALLKPYLDKPVKAVVLGCTHYVFLRGAIGAFLGPKIPLIDGNSGTIRRLEQVLAERGLLRADTAHAGRAAFLTSAADEKSAIAQMESMLRLAMIGNAVS